MFWNRIEFNITINQDSACNIYYLYFQFHETQISVAFTSFWHHIYNCQEIAVEQKPTKMIPRKRTDIMGSNLKLSS